MQKNNTKKKERTFEFNFETNRKDQTKVKKRQFFNTGKRHKQFNPTLQAIRYNTSSVQLGQKKITER